MAAENPTPASAPDSSQAIPHDPYAALRERDYRLMLAGGVIANIGMQMQTAAVGWEIYERTRSAMALGWVGLAQVLPVIALVLPAGHVADRFDRRRVILATQVVLAVGSLGLAAVSHRQAPVSWIYVLLFAIGSARAFLWPARASFLPQIVSREKFSNAVTWNTSGYQLSSVLGPALGGWCIALAGGAMVVYLLDACAIVLYFALVTSIRPRPFTRRREAMSLRSLAAGFGFLRTAPLVLGAITLDMFAVLLGGAVALLPIYARDILEVGPRGYGWMRAAPAIGALVTAFVLAHRPPLRKAGPALLWSVAGFGAATVIFGLSRNYALSIAMLLIIGMLDNVSVVVRHTLVQLFTPDEMRGRVSAINSMFIGASNELGEFESGAVAEAFGPVFSAVAGGIGTLIVVGVIAMLFPPLRRYGRLGSNPN
jgi:MFS family permease